MKRIFSYMIRRTKDDWKATKEDFRGLKDDFKRIDAKTDERIAEKQRKGNERLRKMRENRKEAPSIREAFAESREKQRKKEAERNPGMFKRVLFGTAAVIYVILAVPLTLSIVGIPIAAVLIALAIYSCKRYVFKQPTEYKEETK